MPIEGCWAFRVTRNWDLNIDEEEAEDLLVTIEREVRRRDRGSAVRLQINAAPEEPVSQFLARALNLPDPDVYPQGRPLAISTLLGELSSRPELKQLQDEPFTPSVPATLGDASVNLFDAVRDGDVLLHHPYESFEPVVSFMRLGRGRSGRAGHQDDVVSRRAGQSDRPGAAARRRERKASHRPRRAQGAMDEEANILWARQLEQSGVHVVYGLIGFKTHAKLALWSGGRARAPALRAPGYRELQQRHCAQLFGPVALHRRAKTSPPTRPRSSTSSRDIRSLRSGGNSFVSPLGLKQACCSSSTTRPAPAATDGIVAKMNALADPEVIKALYRASQAGVQIDLLVRGTCCLRRACRS